MVDVEDRELVDAELDQIIQCCYSDLVTSLEIDLTRLFIDQVRGEVTPDQFLFCDENLGEAVFLEPPGCAWCEPLARRQDNLPGARVAQVAGQLPLKMFLSKRHLPALRATPEDDRSVEVRQDLLFGHADGFARQYCFALRFAAQAQLFGSPTIEGKQQRCHRKLATAVDAHIDVVFGVELEVEPGAAIGNYSGSEQILAGRMGFTLIMIKENAR